ncbi:carbonic anhydrase family protein [Microbulbifer sp. CAU 1566]|uniref:carbonic anhydrase family protein n=1 Tax=Microbulbifer sp. CAU 1566 TaxID=2933269 RepID=UPI002002FAE8|nr:carbonic anhydrase family protein [Microbulbifer sp. CAU 1566]MCK7597680.1 carbonic anhydrase family protein [Microbulbifer sp. CAU 1566]
MNSKPTDPHACQSPDTSRRGLLKAALGAGAVGMVGGVGLAGFSGVSYAAALSKEARDAMSPDDVIQMLEQGNERFRNGQMQQHDYLAQKRASATGQYPAAAILSCIDSRTPAEILLDMGLGESFNTRVAGNICNDDVVGSLEFACAAAGAKVILVMGHTACGAVKGAIDGVKMGKLTDLLDEIKPAVKATTYDGDRSSKNEEFVDLVAASNVRRAMNEIRDESEILSALEKEGKLKIVGAMYHLNGGRLEMLD